MMTRNRIILLLGVIVLAVGAYVFYLFNKPHRDVEDEKALAVTADQIFSDYTANEKAANAKYLNKAVEVSGTVQDVKKNQEGRTVVYLKTADPVFGVNCTFKED